MTNENLPLGIRLNNPGNVEWGDPWQGLVPRKESMYFSSTNAQRRRFAQFTTPAYGIRALARTLITYQDKHGIRSVRGAISRWAPSLENNTLAYINQVAMAMGVGPDDPIDVHQYDVLRPMTEAIIRHENGPGPLKTRNSWYDDATIDEALRLAGVRPSEKTVAAVPVTVETVAASAAGVGGVAQVADVLPQISTAITSADAHLSSGNTVRLFIGLVTIAIAVAIAYNQVKRHKAGTL